MDRIDGYICTLVRSAFGHYMWYKIALFPSSVPGTRLSINMPQNFGVNLLPDYCTENVCIQGQRHWYDYVLSTCADLQNAGGLGTCFPRKFLKTRYSEISSEAVFIDSVT